MGSAENCIREDIKQKLQILERERQKYSLNHILNTVLEEIVECPKNLNKESISKIKDIILGSSCGQHILGDATVLGVTVDQTIQLSRIETNRLIEILQKALNEKYKSFLLIETECKPSERTAIQNDKISLLPEQRMLVENLIKYSDMLGQLQNLKTVKLPEVLDNKIEECNVVSKVKLLQAQLAEEKFRLDVFTETDESLGTYKEAIRNIKQQTEECQRQIEELRKIKQKYQDIDCKEYNEILVSYLKLKAELEDNIQ